MENERLTLTPADVASFMERFDRIDEQLRVGAARPMAPLVVSREQAADMLAASVSTVDKWRKCGVLPATYLDGRPRFLVSDLREFAESRPGATEK